MRELLSNNSLFVCQLYEDKSLALHALYNWPPNSELNNSLLELIYFLNMELGIMREITEKHLLTTILNGVLFSMHLNSFLAGGDFYCLLITFKLWTVWTQIRTDKIVWHSDGIFRRLFFWKINFENSSESQQTTTKAWKNTQHTKKLVLPYNFSHQDVFCNKCLLVLST